LAGSPDPQRHRDHTVLRFARPVAGKLHTLRGAGAAGLHVLCEMRWSFVAGLPAVPTRRGTGLDALCALRRIAWGGSVRIGVLTEGFPLSDGIPDSLHTSFSREGQSSDM